MMKMTMTMMMIMLVVLTMVGAMIMRVMKILTCMKMFETDFYFCSSRESNNPDTNNVIGIIVRKLR